PPSAAPSTQKATGRPVNVECTPFTPGDFFVRELKNKGMNVNVVEQPTQGKLRDAVVDVEPCGTAVPAGSTITVTINRGKAAETEGPTGGATTNPPGGGASPSGAGPKTSTTCAPPKMLINGACVGG